jgi:hypothetical protein
MITKREPIDRQRRIVLGAALSGVAEFIGTRTALAQAGQPTALMRAPSSRRLEPLRHVDAGVLNIAYYEEGPADGPVAVLLHGFPYDVHSLCGCRSSLGRQRMPRYRALFARLRSDPISRQGDAALGRTGCDRRRLDGTNGCAWYQARGLRRL